MHQRYKESRNYFIGKGGNVYKLIQSLKYLYSDNNNSIANIHAEFLVKNCEDDIDVLNDFIHASHRIYKDQNNYILNLKILEK